MIQEWDLDLNWVLISGIKGEWGNKFNYKSGSEESVMDLVG